MMSTALGEDADPLDGSLELAGKEDPDEPS
jgi:hypothetical protein